MIKSITKEYKKYGKITPIQINKHSSSDNVTIFIQYNDVRDAEDAMKGIKVSPNEVWEFDDDIYIIKKIESKKKIIYIRCYKDDIEASKVLTPDLCHYKISNMLLELTKKLCHNSPYINYKVFTDKITIMMYHYFNEYFAFGIIEEDYDNYNDDYDRYTQKILDLFSQLYNVFQLNMDYGSIHDDYDELNNLIIPGSAEILKYMKKTYISKRQGYINNVLSKDITKLILKKID